MSGEDDSGGEKSHDPTEQRLEDARKRGEIAKSTDLSVFAAYLGLLIAMGVAGQDAVIRGGEVMSSFFSRADTLSTRLLEPGGSSVGAGLVIDVLAGVSVLFIVPFVLVLLVLAAQQAIIFVPDKLAPKLSRISPIEQAKQKFGLTGLFEFAKSTVKLIVISILLGVFVSSQTDDLVGLIRAPPKAIPGAMMHLATDLLTQITLITLVIAAIDYTWQHFDHRRRQMMTFQDLKEEAKKSEGDPAMKSKRRQRAEEIATNRMMLDVPKANVIVVNPTHYAVALRWSRTDSTAPVVVAKGVDEVALQIRRVAIESGVPIYSDPVTARALEADVAINQEIDPAHYQAVAAAIRFADVIRAKARERSG